MPIKLKDIGKYKRPGIYIEEEDDSLVNLPIQDSLINLVPGFSRKGPFNKPVLVESSTQFKNIFGNIDKKLENRGSYFHRTVLKMLETGPVYALNLLSVDDNDLIDWKSISTTSGTPNKIGDQIPYSKIFNRQDFWERSDESFYDYIFKNKSDGDANFTNRLLQLTNVGNRVSTAFMFKSDIVGFDVTAEEWYGSKSEVPLFMRAEDRISDYMVSVIILEGDWTNYSSLMLDTTWSKYFNIDGLDKTQVVNFVNNKNVVVKGNYDCSLIPDFRDLNDRDMSIKNVINNYTDITGIFCTYNEELLNSADYPNNKIDLLGESLTYSNSDRINFLSYNSKITETLNFVEQELNDINNIFGNYDKDLKTSFSTISVPVGETQVRSCEANNTHLYVDNVKLKETPGFKVINIANYLWENDGIMKSGTEDFPSLIDGDSISFTASFSNITKGIIYYAKMDTDGTNTEKSVLKIYKDSSLSEIVTLPEPADKSVAFVPSECFVIHKEAKFDKIAPTKDSYFIYDKLHPLTLDNINITDYTVGGNDLNEKFYKVDVYYTIANKDNVFVSEGNIVTGINIVENAGNIDVDSTGVLIQDINVPNSVILGYGITYHTTTGSETISNGDGLPENTIGTYKSSYFPVTVDDSGFVPSTSLTLTDTDAVTINLSFNKSVGVSSKFKNINTDEIKDKIINTLKSGKHTGFIDKSGKKIYPTNYTVSSDNTSIEFTVEDSANIADTDGTFLMFFSDNELDLPTELNGFITSTSASTKNKGLIGKDSTMYNQYYNGYINSEDYFYSKNSPNDKKLNLLFYFLDNGDFVIDFVVPDSIIPETIERVNLTNDDIVSISIVSKLGNLKQSIELEKKEMYTHLENTKTIYVDASRYSELSLNSYLEAYIPEKDEEDTTYIPSTGVYVSGYSPRKLVRVVKVRRIEEGDKLFLEISCDGAIKINNIGTIEEPEFQSFSFSELSKYVKTYDGIKLNPFKVKNESLPDGTDRRQSKIMDVLGKGTRLSKALGSKNKISWRYLVDSFGLGLDTTAYPGGSKQQFVDLCGLKKNCLGFISMPSARTFKQSVNPSFTDEDGALSTEYLMSGGNIDLNPDYLYEFGDGEGASAVSYIFNYCNTTDENGTTKLVPPAMFAADTYMQKFLGIRTDLKSFTIMAGITNGLITGIGSTEMDFNEDDLTYLQQLGANPIVFKENNGYVLDSENTASVYPRTSLSLIHAREVLIELENRLFDMLLTYQWKFNNTETRSQIKYAADKICKELLDDGALYDFRNVIDETNNTDYIINLDMGVLDTYIEIVKGMGVIVNNITVLKKGDIQSSGFLS